MVFDLDLTLVNTFSDMSSARELKIYTGEDSVEYKSRIYTLDMMDVVNEPGSGESTRMWGVFRPGWEKFHDFCKEYFEHVLVWSAGKPKYVDAVVDVLFPDEDFQPLAVYTSDDCTFSGDDIYKPLAKMYKDPELVDIVTPENTLVLDDRRDTFSLNKRNGIKIPPYEPNPTYAAIMRDDDRLSKLQAWLSSKKVFESEDVRTLSKRGIFT